MDLKSSSVRDHRGPWTREWSCSNTMLEEEVEILVDADELIIDKLDDKLVEVIIEVWNAELMKKI